MSRQYGHPAATVRELLVPGVAARPQMMKRGDKDLRYANRPSKTAIRRQDWQAPTTLRIDAWGAQGGKQADGYLDTGGEWAYTQPPGRSRSLSGTSPGGMLLLPSETDMQDIDQDFAPAGVTTSAVYLAAGPGACFAAGLPELATGGLRMGYSWCGDEGDLVFSRHDTDGAKTEAFRFRDDGTHTLQPHAEIYVAEGSTGQAVDTTPVQVTGFTNNGVSEHCTADAANDQIEIDEDGTYLVSFQCSFEGSNATVYKLHFRISGALQVEGCHRYLGTSTDEGSCSFVALKDLSDGDFVQVYVTASGATKTFVPIDMQLVVVKVA